MMKRFVCVWMVLLLLLSAMPAASAAASLTYESAVLGFSLTLPGLTEEDVTLEERAGGVDVYHAPSREKWGGLMGSIEVVSPRSAFFSGGYDSLPYQVLAMGEDRVYLWKSPGGGAATGSEELADYSRVAQLLTTDVLRANLHPAHPDSLPVLNTQGHLAYLTAEGGAIRPDAPLTRGELALALYALLEADNKDASFADPFPDVTDPDCARAVAYLASYGILSGYEDGTFRPDAPVSRAAFAVALHRCQFAAPVGRYGSRKNFSDVPDGFWAGAYLDSALVLGWMSGYADGTFRPSLSVTRGPGRHGTEPGPGPGRLPHRRAGQDEPLLRPPRGSLGLRQRAGGGRRTAGGHRDGAGGRPAPGNRRLPFSAPPRRAGPSAAPRCAALPTAGTPGALWDSP